MRFENRGAVLLSALGAVVVIFAFVGSIMSLNALQAARMRHAEEELDAYYAARAGIEAALHLLDRREFGRGGGGESRVFSGNEGAGDAREIYYVHFQERGEGYFEGALYGNAWCRVEWEADEARDKYLIESEGIIFRRGRESSTRMLKVLAERAEGRFRIAAWVE